MAQIKFYTVSHKHGAKIFPGSFTKTWSTVLNSLFNNRGQNLGATSTDVPQQLWSHRFLSIRCLNFLNMYSSSYTTLMRVAKVGGRGGGMVRGRSWLHFTYARNLREFMRHVLLKQYFTRHEFNSKTSNLTWPWLSVKINPSRPLFDLNNASRMKPTFLNSTHSTLAKNAKNLLSFS